MTFGQSYHTGSSFNLYLKQFQQEAVETLSPSERQALAGFLPAPATNKRRLAFSQNRKLVKAWRVPDLLPHLSSLGKGRHLARGRSVLERANCLLCHRFGGLGGPFGPDLSAIGSRATAQYILESILEPSKVVAQEYQNTVLTLKDGNVLIGRIIAEDESRVLMITEPVDLRRTYVPKAAIETRRLSKLSPMPEGLVDSFTEDDIWDLIARLQAGPGEPSPVSMPRNSAGY